MKKRKINEGPISALQRFSNSFFDGLKKNAVNSALKNVKKRDDVPAPLVQKMLEIDKLSNELKDLLEKYE